MHDKTNKVFAINNPHGRNRSTDATYLPRLK